MRCASACRTALLAAVLLLCACRTAGASEVLADGARIAEEGAAAAGTFTGEEDAVSQVMEGIGLDRVQEYLSGAEDGEKISVEALVHRLMAGDFAGIAGDVGGAVYDALFAEIASGGYLIGRILLLGIAAAVFHSFSGIFQNSRIAEAGFFVTYLLLFTLLTAAFSAGIHAASETTSSALGFMRALMPAYFLAVAFSGGSATAAVMYEMTMLGITAAEWVLQTILIPLVRVYLILSMAGNMMKENLFSKMTEISEQAVSWAVRTLLAAVVGFQIVQTMVLPYVDALKNGAVRKMIGMIPGIGQGASAVAQMLLGSGVLVRNCLGMAGVVILFTIAAVPVVKLLVLTLLFQWTAAILEPVCDKRILACISAAARGNRLLLKIAGAAVLLFVVVIAVVCAGTNAVYYA